MKSILDPTFKYTNSASTDISKTFARVRKRMAEEAAARQQQQAKHQPVVQLKRESK